MVISQLSPDTATVNNLWRLLHGLNEATEGLSPTTGNGFELALKVLIFVLALLVVAVFAASGTVIWIFSKWRSDQAAGIKALSTSKDATKREITQLLRDELGNARAAAAADTKELRESIKQHSNLFGSVIVDLAILGQKLKIPMRSGHQPPPKEGGD